MPLSVSIIDPHTGETLPHGWAWGYEISLNSKTKTGRIVYEAYATTPAAYAVPPLEPIMGRSVEIRPERQEAVYGSPPLLTPYKPAEYRTVREPRTNGPDDPGEFELVSPAQDPVYGPAPLVRPAVPSFDEYLAAHPEIFALLMGAVDRIGLDVVPEFAGGVVVPPGPPED